MFFILMLNRVLIFLIVLFNLNVTSLLNKSFCVRHIFKSASHLTALNLFQNRKSVQKNFKIDTLVTRQN